MLKKDAKSTTEDVDIYGPYNTYTSELKKDNNLYVNRVGTDGETQEEENKKSKNDKIYKQPTKTGIAKDGTLQDMVSDADNFVDASTDNVVNIKDLKSLSKRIYSILFEIGVGASVIIGLVLGIKFFLSGVQEKAEVKKMLWVYVIGCVVTFGAFGIWKLVVTISEQM